MEHLHHFGLSEDPFRNEPLPRDFFDTRSSRDALTRLDRGLRQAKGLLLLVGDVGAGKTMVVRRLLESLEEEVFEAGMLVVLNGAADACWLLTRFATQLGIEQPERERDALLAQVYEQLAIVREDGRHTVLIIDDAHLLSSQVTLAEVCGLLKLEYEDRRLFSLVLAGGDELDAAIAADPTLAQRVQVRVRMTPLDTEDAAAYLGRRLQQAGGDPTILDAGAVTALHRLGRGLPGLMNTLADNALFEAFLCGRRQMTAGDVERAHRDLGWAPPAVTPLGAAPVGGAAELPSVAPPAAVRAELRSLAPPPPELGELESDLEAVFEQSASESRSPAPPTEVPVEGPPKEDEDGPEDLVVELLDD